MWSFHVPKSSMSLGSADTWQEMYCSTLSFMSLRICCILLMSSLAYPSASISGVTEKSMNIVPSANSTGSISDEGISSLPR